MADLHLTDMNSWTTEPTRKGFGRGLVRAGELNPQVVALCADLTGSTQIEPFAKSFPDRFIEVGIAEQNMVTVASGLAKMGKIPFTASYAAFSPGRNWEQIRTTICLNNQNVKIVGAHAGLYTGPDGATHQMLEDIALMRVLPNMVVIAPGDAVEAEKATLAIASDTRPAYIRLARDETAILTTDKTPFEIGKAYVYSPGRDMTIVSTGVMTGFALEAAEKLFHQGIDAEVIHCPTIKPLDAATILGSVKKTGRVLSIEEAQINGGLGGAVAELLAEQNPAHMIRMGVKDKFGQSGTPHELLDHYGLSVKHIILQAHALMEK
ncbi:MAG TPA: transketolase family protein [Candidatus Saccharibacteria bacterium]|nr:transketolase family protein [Candidatus Saccharibacteria bacterium]